MELQYGGRKFSKIVSSFISAMDWDISLKFGMQINFWLLKQMPSLKLKPGVDFWRYGRHLENSMWRHNSGALRKISMILGRQTQNDMLITTNMSKFQYGGRPFS